MSALNSLPLPVVRLLAFFHEELSERRPGRVPQTVQLWVGCLLVILISMTFEIPFVALSLAVLFYGIQSNAFYTKFVAILFVVATVLEIGSLFLIYKWSYGEPLIRLIIAGPILMGCMFLMRTHRLGLVFFAVAIVAIYGQTFPAMLDYPEVVVRLTLWCIVVGLYPTLLMTLIGVLWFPSRAITQMHQALNDRLDDAISHLTDSLAPLPETRIEREALALQKLNVFCLADDANWRTQSAWWQSCVATVTYIYSTLNRYDPTSFADSQAIIEFRQKLASEINKLQHAVAEGQCWQSDWRISESEAMAARECNLENICQTLLQLGQMDPNTPPTPAAKPPSMAADAFTNPDYMRYAVKTLLACLICYTFYSGVDWEGIHTCMLTCVIVANPNVGSSYQKMVLRFGGAFCGAILALLFTLLVMPWLDNIVELLFVLAPIFLLGAWIATSSERSSYIGTQMVVTFALATLENVFGPVYDLVEIRDRALGIIIGTVVSAVIYTFVWPESEARTLPQKLAGALGMLSKVMRIPRQQEVTALRTYLQIRIGLHAAFNACEEMCQRVALERQLDSPGINARHGTGTRSHAMINRQLSRLLLCSILGSTTLISGCALVRKDSAPHQQLKPEQIKLADDIHLASSGWPQAQWWKQLNDPQLDALIQRTLSGSHTLAEAKLREEKAQSQADLLDAGSQLQVAALGMLNRQRVSANGFLSPYAMDAPALGMDGPYYTEATVGLFAGLDLDLWGVHRSAVAAAIGAHNAALAETAAVELSLTTGVAQLYYSMQASYQMLDLLEQTRDVIDYAVKAHQSKVAHGLEAQVPFHGARAQILAVDKQIAAVKGQITETRESLRALIGAGASDMPEIKPVALPRVQTGIPATLSYELLARRPDLQAMRWYVQASLDQVDSARALFYPSFDIKAFFGLDAIHLDTLFKKTSRQFNFIPGLKLPLFDGGRLNANLEGTRAASNMMIERYNQSVLNAVRDVAVNGTRLQTLNDEREMQAERVEATRFTQRAAEAAYQRGLTSRLQATEARLPVLAEEMSLLMLDSRRVIQSIQLMKSLGGGYQAAPVVEKK
ncbi:multidrug efflux transporter permease subunit MdtO [Escherichia coli]|nr:multidrug efflux transporter permease subunit MdtO [Escherichia coli]OYI44186.1 multidrug resistance transporter [Shigella sonnei]EHK9038960.1 multidrug efflux transporter permease subunit MdtO [Escherichia coli]EJF3477619.1 multidrug efflux transporter permease subunit MdtO [Escherichia coli]EJF3606574.1 multidrug efflux transporter permease subunit MdtO [Escherichia coli]